MRHPDRWDLPKGHVDAGESNLQCALREFEEETGVAAGELDIDPRFRFRSQYTVCSERTGHQPSPKLLLIFLARLRRDVQISPTEHDGFQWFDWQPPHRIQAQTIDPLLNQLQRHWAD